MQQQMLKQISIPERIEAEMRKMPKWAFMLLLVEKGPMSAYQAAKELKWSTGKAHGVIRALERSESVKTKLKVVNGRAVKMVELGR